MNWVVPGSCYGHRGGCCCAGERGKTLSVTRVLSGCGSEEGEWCLLSWMIKHGQVLMNSVSKSHFCIYEDKRELGETSVGHLQQAGEISLLLLFVCSEFARHSTWPWMWKNSRVRDSLCLWRSNGDLASRASIDGQGGLSQKLSYALFSTVKFAFHSMIYLSLFRYIKHFKWLTIKEKWCFTKRFLVYWIPPSTLLCNPSSTGIWEAQT